MAVRTSRFLPTSLHMPAAYRSLYLTVLSICLFAQSAPEANDWPSYGRDPGSSRFSPLDQINTENVSRLKRAWTYHTGETGRGWETTPIVVGGVLYFSTHNQNIVALDSETGKEIWNYRNPHPTGREHRGVSYWPGEPGTPPRLVFGTGDGRLVELDAKTRLPVVGFGDNGTANLRTGYTEKFPQAPYADLERIPDEGGPAVIESCLSKHSEEFVCASFSLQP